MTVPNLVPGSTRRYHDRGAALEVPRKKNLNPPRADGADWVKPSTQAGEGPNDRETPAVPPVC